MDKKAPLYQKLQSHFHSRSISFHVPGHKMGNGFNPLGQNSFSEILKIDMTEITGLDDLHHPDGVILEAEKLAAHLFKADETFFLVNGSTVGNMAMVLAVCQPGDKIIVQSNVHKSVIHAMMLARVQPIYISPELIMQLGISGSIRLEQVKEAIFKHPDAKALFLMNPNYYGIGIDLSDMIELAHHYHIPVLVDEAHGAHFGLHPAFPKSSLAMGADVVVQSTHKTLSAMTMGSMLHVKKGYVDVDRIRFFLSLLQSSSPSYPIMASLDLTRHWIQTEGESLWKEPLENMDWFYDQLRGLSRLQLQHHLDDHYYTDPLKIIIHSLSQPASGFFIQRQLESRGIFPELADPYNVLAIVTFGTNQKDIEKLAQGLKEIDQEIAKTEKETDFHNTFHAFFKDFSYIFKNKESIISLEKVIYSQNKAVPLHEAIGKIAAEMVIPYPPGIPVLQLGERITKEVIDYLVKLKKSGARFQGVQDPTFQQIKVLDTEAVR